MDRATERQRDYIRDLKRQVDPDYPVPRNLSVDEASEVIDDLLAMRDGESVDSGGNGFGAFLFALIIGAGILWLML